MNSAGKYAVAALLLILISGCAEKSAKTVPPAQAQAPTLDTGKAGAIYPPPLTQSTPQPATPAPAPAPEVVKTEPPPPPAEPPASSTSTAKSKHKPKPAATKPAGTAGTNSDAAPSTATTATPPAATAAAAPSEPATDVAAGGEPAAASPIGQISTGDTAGQTQARKDATDLITNTENGLNAIKRTLNPQEQETATQIRTFLTKAKQALGNADLDAAFTLATKAKVLLDELNKT